MVSVKMCFGGEVRRFSVQHPHELTFPMLLLRAQGFNLQGRLRFTYVDDESERVTVTSNEDLEEAFLVASELKRALRFDIDVTPNPSPAGPVHTRVSCDMCGMSPIVGVRYKCGVREDFDMCETCEENSEHLYPCIKIYTPAHAPAAIITVLHHDQAPEVAVAKEVDVADIQPTVCDVMSRVHGSAVEETKAEVEAVPPFSSERALPKLAAEMAVAKAVDVTEIQPMVSETMSRVHAAAVELPPQARFVSDVNFPDGSVVFPGQAFSKIWRVRNDATSWPEGVRLMPAGGDLMSGPLNGVEVPRITYGETIDLRVELQAPSRSGRFIGYWRLQTADGDFFGHRLWADVVVPDQATTEEEVNAATEDADDEILEQALDDAVVDIEWQFVQDAHQTHTHTHVHTHVPTEDIEVETPIIEPTFNLAPIEFPAPTTSLNKWRVELDVIASMGLDQAAALLAFPRHIRTPASQVGGFVDHEGLNRVVDELLMT